MFTKLRVLTLLGVLAALVAVSSEPCFACFCVPELTPEEQLAQSSAVFSGEVISIEPAADSLWKDVDSVYVTFQVSEVWKGSRRHVATVLTARSVIDCGYEFERGKKYLVYAEGPEERLTVWFCSRTRPLSAAEPDLSVLGSGAAPKIDSSRGVGIEVHPSTQLSGKRETSQSFAYFVPWNWLSKDDQLSKERVGFAFWNTVEKAPIVSRLLWHGTVYGGKVIRNLDLALIEKIGSKARMTGPWRFSGGRAYRVGVDDQSLVATLTGSRVRLYTRDAADAGTEYVVQSGDTLGRIAQELGTTVRAIAQANNIANPNIVFEGQTIVIPATSRPNFVVSPR